MTRAFKILCRVQRPGLQRFKNTEKKYVIALGLNGFDKFLYFEKERSIQKQIECVEHNLQRRAFL